MSLRFGFWFFLNSVALVMAENARTPPPYRETVLSDGYGPECHASNVIKTPDGALMAVWFSGAKEGADDVVIRFTRRDPQTREWSVPITVADHQGIPCWNPVLVPAKDGSVTLYYKASKLIPEWQGFWKRSSDGGKTWTEAKKLPATFLGPIRCRALALHDGSLLFGSSDESADKSLGNPWRPHFEILSHPGDPSDATAWQKIVPNPGEPPFNAIQPSVVLLPDGQLLALLRTREKVVAQSTSRDLGRSWTPLKATSLPNPNSGLEAVVLSDGRVAAILNHGTNRLTLDAVLRNEEGQWGQPLLLDQLKRGEGEVSYPSALLDQQDGHEVMHVVYTRKRREIVLRTFDLRDAAWTAR